MMIDTIRGAIASVNAENTTKISDWRLVERILSRQERYYIGNRAEQARTVDDLRYSLTVYVDSSEDEKKFEGNNDYDSAKFYIE